MRSARLTLTATSLAILTLLTSCVSDIDQLVDPKTTGATVMTPDEAKHDLWNRLDAAQETLGGTWDEQDSPIANQCDEGFYYDAVRRRNEPVTDLDAPTTALKAFWDADNDYTVKPNSFRPTQRQLIARSANDTSLAYYLEEGDIMIIGEGPCIPGDFGQVRRDDIRKLHEPETAESPSPEDSR